MCPPRLWTSCTIRFLIELVWFSITCSSIASHSWLWISKNWSEFCGLGLTFQSARLSMAHRFSIRFISGEMAGHGRTFWNDHVHALQQSPGLILRLSFLVYLRHFTEPSVSNLFFSRYCVFVVTLNSLAIFLTLAPAWIWPMALALSSSDNFGMLVKERCKCWYQYKKKKKRNSPYFAYTNKT